MKKLFILSLLGLLLVSCGKDPVADKVTSVVGSSGLANSYYETFKTKVQNGNFAYSNYYYGAANYAKTTAKISSKEFLGLNINVLGTTTTSFTRKLISTDVTNHEFATELVKIKAKLSEVVTNGTGVQPCSLQTMETCYVVYYNNVYYTIDLNRHAFTNPVAKNSATETYMLIGNPTYSLVPLVR